MPTVTLVQALNDALRTAMRADDRVVLLGEDIGRNGGVFRVTEGLLEDFGAERVLDTPLSETGIIGAAVGMALYGLRPVVEIQFVDFIYPAFDQVVSEVAKYRYRSGGSMAAPVVIRAPYGAGVRGGPYHSQSPEAYFVHTPGLKVVVPSTPRDAKGLLLAALKDPDPVVFLEPKRLYRSAKGEVPEGAYDVPIGRAQVVREGSRVSVITFGAMVPVCVAAARAAEAKGIDVEVLDLRTLLPLDEPALLASVRKTGRAVIVHEAPRTGGVGAEIAAVLAEKAIDSLHAPIQRVTGFDTPVPFSLESLYVPDPPRVLEAIERVAAC
jgi:2-oxoisovalerate dehydrogenase E1 component beta subunit